MTPLYKIGIVAVLGCNIFAAYAQEEIKGKQADSSLGIVPVTRQDSLFNGIEIVAGTDKKTASFKYVPQGVVNGFSVTVSTPLNEKGGDTTFYDSDTDAFANSTSVTFNLRRTILIDSNPVPVAKLALKCYQQPQMFGYEQDEKDKCFSAQKADDLVGKVLDAKADVELKKLVGDFAAELAKPLWFYGATATYSRKEFEYFLEDSAATNEVTENPWGMSAYASYVKPGSYMVTLALEYQKGYETDGGGKTSIRCPLDTDVTSYVECQTARLSAPVSETNKNIKISFRMPFKISEQPVAVAPQFVFDFEDSEKSWSVPLYLFGNGDGGLTGGVRYDYDSSNGKGGIYSLFIGSKFDI